MQLSEGVVNFIIGYLILINIVGFYAMFIVARMYVADKLNNQNKADFLLTILSMIGGCVGVLVCGEMTGYKEKSKVVKKLIPFIITAEIIAILGIIYVKMKS